jgi:hypothetical protein
MQRPTTFFKRFGSMMLAGYGIAASAAHADPSSSAAAGSTTTISSTAAVSSNAAVGASSAQVEAQRQCAASNGAGALARFETGTTFMLTENGLIVLKRPATKKWYSAVKSDEPENLNTGG